MRASSVRWGVSSQLRPRQIFMCRFELKNGQGGQHRYTEIIPRLVTSAGVCPECGQPTEPWSGAQVFPNYQFTAQPIAEALVRLAAGAGHRQGATGLRGAAGSHLGTTGLAFSREPHLIQRLTEVLAPLLHDALAPETKAWPEGGLIAVDAVRFNLLGSHKFTDDLKPVEHATADLLEMLDPDEAEDQAARKALAARPRKA